MHNRVIVRQLLALREQVDAMLEMLAVDEMPECKHSRRDDLTTFGGPTRWACRDCGYIHEEVADG